MSKWKGGHNLVSDMDGEYYRGSGWTLRKTLLRSTNPGIHLEIVLYVHESQRRHWEHVPATWLATLRINDDAFITPSGTSLFSCKGKTRSLASAKRQADTWLANTDAPTEALKAYYSKPNAYRVMARLGEQRMTLFGLSQFNKIIKEQGEYVIESCASDFALDLNIRNCGYSTHVREVAA